MKAKSNQPIGKTTQLSSFTFFITVPSSKRVARKTIKKTNQARTNDKLKLKLL